MIFDLPVLFDSTKSFNDLHNKLMPIYVSGTTVESFQLLLREQFSFKRKVREISKPFISWIKLTWAHYSRAQRHKHSRVLYDTGGLQKSNYKKC